LSRLALTKTREPTHAIARFRRDPFDARALALVTKEARATRRGNAVTRRLTAQPFVRSNDCECAHGQIDMISSLLDPLANFVNAAMQTAV
jgi:hypothetical protein